MRAGIVARLDLIGDLGEAAAHRRVIGADTTWKEQVDDRGGLAERQPCTKLGLDTDELGRGAPFQKHRHTSASPARFPKNRPRIGRKGKDGAAVGGQAPCRTGFG
jgi:hypothetical protein